MFDKYSRVFTGFRSTMYLNVEGFLGKSLKIKSAIKGLDNHCKALKCPGI